MTDSPKRVANEITKFLDAVYYANPSARFPVDVIEVAKEWSSKKIPDEPIVNIFSADLEGGEGFLDGRYGWNIAYNKNSSPGRQRFTVAHEFGHYLLHRQGIKEILMCNNVDMNKWDSDESNRESQANVFASWLLMPPHDFRKQITGKSKNLETIRWLADRYGTSLSSTALKFLEITNERAVVVSVVDGFIEWSWSSDSAYSSWKILKSGVEVPVDTLAASQTKNLIGIHKKRGGWFDDVEYDEMNLPQRDNYNLTLLILDSKDYEKEPDDAFIRISDEKRTVL